MSGYTLLLELRGPQQAWGSRSRFATRDTERAPTRSGVIGLVAAALGVARTEPLDRFDALEFGVRIDRPGRMERDFQTAAADDGASMPLSHRYYLTDAVFLAGLGSPDRDLLAEIQRAMRTPAHPPYLGRRAFPPAGPIRTDLVDGDVRTALTTAERRASTDSQARRDERALEILVDARPGEIVAMSLRDVPRSFDPRRRVHEWRDVTALTTVPADDPHAPMRLVADEEV